MMQQEPVDAVALKDAVTRDLGTDNSQWFRPDGYDGLALCVLDSIYSTGNRYDSVLKMLARYRQLRLEEGGDPATDGPSDLMAAAHRWGGPEGFVTQTGYRWRVSTRPNAPYKADPAIQAAGLLDQEGYATVQDIRCDLSDPQAQSTSATKRRWLQLPGQRSGLTWTYFLMLAGVPGVKADRMVIRYVSRAVGHPVDAHEAAQLVREVADRSDVAATFLDHSIWRKESGRPIYVYTQGAPAS